MTFRRTFNFELIREVMTHPAVYPHISDDGSPAPENYQPIQHDGICYVEVRDGAELLGLWVFAAQNAVCWEVHTCLLPSAWGPRAGAASLDMARWIFANTPCRRIVTNVPEYNRLALRFARAAGMTEYGRNPQSYLRGGKLHDQIQLGISKEAECQNKAS